MSVRGVLVDTVNHTVGVADVDGSLSDYYRVLNCQCFDVVNRRIGSKYYSIYCDDEGLLKEDFEVSAIRDDDFSPMLVGNLFICNTDNEGNTTSLNKKEIRSIMDHFKPVYIPDKFCIALMLMAGY